LSKDTSPRATPLIASGFGSEVRAATARRTEVLVAQGHARRTPEGKNLRYSIEPQLAFYAAMDIVADWPSDSDWPALSSTFALPSQPTNEGSPFTATP
jgi:hypothetical protein